MTKILKLKHFDIGYLNLDIVCDLEFGIWNLQCWAFHWKLEISF